MALGIADFTAQLAALQAQFKAGTIDEEELADGLRDLWTASENIPALFDQMQQVIDVKAAILTAWQAALNIKGTVTAVSGLPSSAPDRDAYRLINAADALNLHLFVRIAGAWVDIGIIGGERGPSAYDVAVANGFEGTEEEYAALPISKADLAQEKADLAEEKAGLAQEKADLAQEKADFAQEQGAAAAEVVAGAATILAAVPIAEGARDDAEVASAAAVTARAVVETIVENGGGLQLFDDPADDDDIAPIAADDALGLLIGALKSSGKAVGSIIASALAQAVAVTRRIGGDEMHVYHQASSTGVYPIAVDDGLGVLLGYDRSTGKPVGHVVDTLKAYTDATAASATGGRTRGDLLEAASRPALAGWNGFFSYGQSLSVGAQGQPPLSTSQPYNNLTFGGGPKVSSANVSTNKPLVEDSLAEGGSASGNRGETVCSGMANWAVQLAAIEAGINPSEMIIFSSAPGQGGQPIANLKKGTSYYNRLLAHVTGARTQAVAAGKTFAVPAVTWIQGESDCTVGTARATYLAEMKQLATDIDTDVRAITGQSFPVRLLVYQTPFHAVSSAGSIVLAQKDAIDQGPLIHFVTPFYFLPYNAIDETHSVNVGYLLAGRYFGRAFKQLVIDGREPDCIWPISATAKAAVLKVKFRVPRQPLQFDTASLAAATNYGFKVVDDTGPLTLSAITASEDTVTITLNRSLGANPKVRYALDYLGTGLHIEEGASGNLRDSTADICLIDGVTKSMAHWAPHFELPISKLDATS